MKQQENNEIDNLLRAWSGRASESRPGVTVSSHLDVDELSSYAEGVLPEATRARYTSHLIDCDDCRKIVGQLAVAAGKAIPDASIPKTVEQSSWGRALAAFFSPAVLRFAVPAMLLVFVGVIFFASRRSGEVQHSARTSNNESTASTSAPNASPAALTNPQGTAQQELSKATGRPETKSSPQANDSASRTKSADSRSQESVDTTASNAAVPADKKPSEEPAKENKPVVARESQTKSTAQPAAVAPPPPAPKPEANASAKDAAGARADQDTLADRAARKREADKQAQGYATDGERGRDAERQKSKTLGVAAAATRRGEDDEKSSEDNRMVAGHRFNKRDGVWYDSAFKSGTATVTISRGSEQYRALVADEPEIAVIAKQLSGQIFLLWKGRGYHIK